MQIKHLFLAAIAVVSLGCASVKMRQALPIYTPEGCKVIDNGGIDESGNYFYANGYSTDPGTLSVQVASANARITYACSDDAMQRHFSKLYDAYMTAEFNNQQGGNVDEKFKKTNAAIVELNGSMVTLAKIVAKSGGKAEEKKETGAAGSAAPAPTAPAPAAASIDAAFIVQLQTAKNKAELVNMLLAGAKQYPADADLLNRLAGKASLSKDENFATDRGNIAKALEGGIR